MAQVVGHELAVFFGSDRGIGHDGDELVGLLGVLGQHQKVDLGAAIGEVHLTLQDLNGPEMGGHLGDAFFVDHSVTLTVLFGSKIPEGGAHIRGFLLGRRVLKEHEQALAAFFVVSDSAHSHGEGLAGVKPLGGDGAGGNFAGKSGFLGGVLDDAVFEEVIDRIGRHIEKEGQESKAKDKFPHLADFAPGGWSSWGLDCTLPLSLSKSADEDYNWRMKDTLSLTWEHRFASRADHMKSSAIRELLKLAEQPDFISFAGGFPAPEFFPAKEIASVIDGICDADSLQYGPTEGYRPLRQLWADRLGRKVEEVIITTGSQQALDLLGKVLVEPGSTVLVENPTYLAALQACSQLGFIAHDAECLARAWQARALRTGSAQPEQWPDEPQDFGLQRLPRAQQFAACPERLGLYAVLPDTQWVGRMARAGVPTVQLRFKSDDVQAAVEAVQGTGALLFINDHWRDAIDARAYGIHLGQEDLDALTAEELQTLHRSGLRLGVSTHGYAEMVRADAVGPSYIAMGAVFPTTLKKMATAPQGVGRLGVYARLMRHYPQVAIGGISAEQFPTVLATGVGSVAVVRALVNAPDPEASAAALMALMR